MKKLLSLFSIPVMLLMGFISTQSIYAQPYNYQARVNNYPNPLTFDLSVDKVEFHWESIPGRELSDEQRIVFTVNGVEHFGDDYFYELAIEGIIDDYLDFMVDITYEGGTKLGTSDANKGFYINASSNDFSFTFWENGQMKKIQMREWEKYQVSAVVLKKPAISAKDSIINNIDKPYTLDQIKQIAEIEAYDEYYGDLTDSIIITDNQYESNQRVVGVFPITFSVTNPSGLTSETIINIVNRDITKPILTGPSETTISYKTATTAAEIISKYTATDNYDQDLDIILDNTDYISGKVGTFYFNLKATDKAGNIGTAKHKVIVIDDVKPTITDEHIDPIELSWKQNYTNADLLIGLTASDEVDGIITNKITIKTSNFESGKIGTYTVVYQVKDTAGNIFEHTRIYKVITTDNPIFYVSKNLLLIEDINKMTVDQIVQEIARYENLNIENYTVITDNYTGNEHTDGTYKVAFRAVLSNGETLNLSTNMRVFNLDAERPDYREPNFFEKVWNFLYQNILKHIVNFFIWILNIFNHIIRFFGVKWELLKYLV